MPSQKRTVTAPPSESKTKRRKVDARDNASSNSPDPMTGNGAHHPTSYTPSLFESRIDEEVRRGHRYNRFFAMAILLVDGSDPQNRLATIRRLLRDTDIVGLLTPAEPLPSIDATSLPIGILMPETRRSEGVCALHRILETSGPTIRKFAIVGYPDDGTRRQPLILSALQAMHRPTIKELS